MSLTLRAYDQPCTPPIWARGGHAQTILGHVLPAPAESLVDGSDGVQSHEIALPCGDRLRVLHRAGRTGTLVHIFHGLSGDANSDYVRHAAAVASALGHGVLAVNHRGCGAGRGLARGVYHSGRADDLGEVFAWSRERFGQRTMALGFSLSGNALLLLLARGGEVLPDAAIAINPPIDLARCSSRISSGVNRLYDWRFVRRVTQSMRERERDHLLPAGFRIPRARTLRELDDKVTAPLAGFADADDYYARCSTYERLSDIETPTVVLTSADDPFVSVSDFESAQRSRSVHLHIEANGGHVGYITRRSHPMSHARWLDGALRHYLRELDAHMEFDS
jgi:uncharacterized protein